MEKSAPDRIARLERRLKRERAARKEAENLLEQKSLGLYEANLELRQLADVLAIREKSTRAILEAVVDGIITFNEEGVIVSANPATYGIFGCSQNEILGQDIDHFITFHQLSKQNVQAGSEDTPFTSFAGEYFESTGHHKDGRDFPVHLGLSEVEFEDQRLFTLSVRDISRRKAMEEALQLAHDELEQRVEERTADLQVANEHLQQEITEHLNTQQSLAQARDQALEASRLKSEFLATMSHEIRTPLNGVIGMAELLQHTPLDEDQQDFSETIATEAQHLLQIINDILDFSKIEANKVILEHRPFDLKQLLDSLIALNGPMAESKGLGLQANLDPRIPQQLIGDAGRLRQVLLNLVGNAMKFTAQGYVRVAVEMLEQNGRRLKLAFQVEDTGIGIADAAQKMLFDPFTQADGSTTRKFGGTGLGLAISKRLVNLMKGDIRLESALGQGSIFRFTAEFGYTPTAKTENEFSEKADQAETDTGKTILLVEDNAVNQKVFRRQLKLLNYTVDIVSDGHQAIERYKMNTQHYDLILMDCQMPQMDGVTATRHIREFEQSQDQHIPIIAVTANAMKGDRDACIRAGMSDYISKPIKLDALQTVLHKWLAESSESK